jgi:hypothetical protein
MMYRSYFRESVTLKGFLQTCRTWAISARTSWLTFAVAFTAALRGVEGRLCFDSRDRESKQIDLVVAGDFAPNFGRVHDIDKAFTCVEVALGALAVKSNLSRDELWDALDNLSTVPPPPDVTGRLNPLMKLLDGFTGWPIKIGPSVETVYNNLMTSYEQRVGWRTNHVHAVIVNRSCCISCTGSGGVLNEGSTVPGSTFFAMQGPKMGAFALMYVITRIQGAANVASNVLFSFGDYLDAVRWLDGP